MDKRTLLAAALMALVIVLTPRIFSSRSAPPPVADTSAASSAPPSSGTPNNPAQPAAQTPAIAPPSAAPSPAATRAGHPIERAATLTTPRASFELMNPGASPGDVSLPAFRDLRPGPAHGSPAVVAPIGPAQLSYRLASGRDTIALDTLQFTVTPTPTEVTY